MQLFIMNILDIMGYLLINKRGLYIRSIVYLVNNIMYILICTKK